ncbi:MAG: hypothetical protein FWC27_07245 [Firmicutes bacterium]|nr:hypothetical protein [Bacillota bacterium]
MKITTKRLLALSLALITVLCAAPLAAAAGEDTRYYDWKQYDPRWGSVVLTNQTMKQVGCLATSIAMLAVRSGLRDESGFDPGIFAAEMKKAGGFDADDDLLWEALPKAVAGLTAQTPWESLNGTRDEKTAILKGYLDKGCQVAVAVRNGGHWVALRAVTGGKAVMMDPGSAATDLFGAYPAAGVTRVALLRADKPGVQAKEESTMTENIIAFLKDVGVLLLEVFKWFYAMGK